MRNNPPLSIVSKSLLVTFVLAASCWLCYRPTPAVAQSTATPLLYNMEQFWHWGGLIDTMRPVGDTLYATMGKRFVIFDITTPASPKLLGQVDLNDWLFDLEIVGTHALVAAGRSGLAIIDISDKQAPRLVLDSLAQSYVEHIAVSEPYIYITDGDGIEILDMSDPEHPVVVNAKLAGLGFDPAELQIAHNHLFVAGGRLEAEPYTYQTWGMLQAFALDDPIAPTPLPVYSTAPARNRYWQFDALQLQGNDAYAVNDNGIYRFAITTPLSITLRSTLTLPSLNSFTLTSLGDHLYVGKQNSRYMNNGGIYALETSSFPTMTVSDFFTQPVFSLAARDNQLFVGRYDDGLHILDVTEPHSPQEIGRYRALVSDRGGDMVEQSSFLYITGNAGVYPTLLLSIVDLRNPAQPALSAVVTGTDELVAYPFIDDNRLIFSAKGGRVSKFDNFQIFDVTEPTAPQRLIRQETPAFWTAAYANHQLYLETLRQSPSSAEIRIFDLSTPTAPMATGVMQTAPQSLFINFRDFTVRPPYLYYVGIKSFAYSTATKPYHLFVHDLTTGWTIADLELPWTYSLYHFADTIYATTLAWGNCGDAIYLIDVADPAKPRIRQSYCWDRIISDLLVDGNLLYIADIYDKNVDNQSGLAVIDFTIPHAPQLAGYARKTGIQPQVAKIDDVIYVLEDGLSAYRYTPPQAVAQLTAGGVLTAPADAITYTFPSTAFAEPVVVTHTTHYVDPWLAFSAPWVGIGNAFALTSTAPTTGAFTLTIGYPAEAAQLGEVATLTLYRWADGVWVAEPSVVDPATQTVTATPTTTGVWLLRALARNRLYLPIIHHTQP